MILIELLEGYDPTEDEYSTRHMFGTAEEMWDYLTDNDYDFTYLHKSHLLTWEIVRNAMEDIRHSRTIVSGSGKRYRITPYELTD